MATRPLSAPQQAPPQLRVIGGSVAGRRLSVGAVLMLVLTVFCVAAMQAYAAQVGFRVASVERQVRQRQEETTLLQARDAQLSSPERLADTAAKFGLVTDPSPTFLRAPAQGSPDEIQTLDALHKLLSAAP